MTCQPFNFLQKNVNLLTRIFIRWMCKSMLGIMLFLKNFTYAHWMELSLLFYFAIASCNQIDIKCITHLLLSYLIIIYIYILYNIICKILWHKSWSLDLFKLLLIDIMRKFSKLFFFLRKKFSKLFVVVLDFGVVSSRYLLYFIILLGCCKW